MSAHDPYLFAIKFAHDPHLYGSKKLLTIHTYRALKIAHDPYLWPKAAINPRQTHTARKQSPVDTNKLMEATEIKGLEVVA